MHPAQGKCTGTSQREQKTPETAQPVRMSAPAGDRPQRPQRSCAPHSPQGSVWRLAMLREGKPPGMQRGAWEATRPQVPGLTAPASPGLALHLLPAGPAQA
ncbi:butyrophilin subfamily 2 member A2-like [Platysternon megacephalum]|uniref:Butyrophilin subfamily 2 member A2-like n=1 Tax=Platysternon megacephalum TaxID=55544 RepID=A0A4D9DR20_9SAUR|nr:butyrophilin subfamily 2 member A2-like [Platysternon megacephalum]